MFPKEERGMVKMFSQNSYMLRNSYEFSLDIWRSCGFIFLFQRGEGQSEYRLRLRTRVTRLKF